MATISRAPDSFSDSANATIGSGALDTEDYTSDNHPGTDQDPGTDVPDNEFYADHPTRVSGGGPQFLIVVWDEVGFGDSTVDSALLDFSGHVDGGFWVDTTAGGIDSDITSNPSLEYSKDGGSTWIDFSAGVDSEVAVCGEKDLPYDRTDIDIKTDLQAIADNSQDSIQIRFGFDRAGGDTAGPPARAQSIDHVQLDVTYTAGGPTTVTISATLDGIIKKQDILTTSSLDALLQKTFTKATTLDSLLQKTRQAINTLDAVLTQEEIILTTSLHAQITKLSLTLQASMDALISQRNTLTTSLDAQVQKTITLVASLDALLTSLGETKSTSMDAIIIVPSGAVTLTTNLNAMLSQLGITRQTSLDSILQKEIVINVSLDAVLTAIGLTRQVDLDGLLTSLDLTRNVNLDAFILLAGQALITSIDSILTKSNIAKTVNLEALLQGAVSVITSLNGVLTKQGVQVTTNLDAILILAPALSTQLDALLLARQVISNSLNAIIQGSNTITTSFDAVVGLQDLPGIITITEQDCGSSTVIH